MGGRWEHISSMGAICSRSNALLVVIMQWRARIKQWHFKLAGLEKEVSGMRGL